jgi:hypothetical protein
MQGLLSESDNRNHKKCILTLCIHSASVTYWRSYTSWTRHHQNERKDFWNILDIAKSWSYT